MKVKIERKASHCPEFLKCVACNSAFKVEPVRHLLYSDRSLLQGDLCPTCSRSHPRSISKKIRHAAESILKHPHSKDFNRKEALEMLLLAEEKVEFPNFLQQWLARIAILAEETQELEKARLGLGKCYCQERQQLEKILEKTQA